MSTTDFNPLKEEPLVSNRVLLKLLAFLLVMATLTMTMVIGGNWLGNRITLAGHSDSREIFNLTIGRDRIALPANVIRFDTQRHNGTTERADLYLLWPEMEGYSRTRSARFNGLSHSGSLIFIQITQSVMSRDMSGRIEPIYAHSFSGPAEDAGNGLTIHRLKADAGQLPDVLLTGKRPGMADFAVRCMLPASPDKATSGDCQRDIFAGQDLSVLYRFSSTLLPEWQKLDAAVAQYVGDRLSKASGANTKMR